LAWAGDVRVRPRTQASLAITADGENWVLINASPDLPQQLRRSNALHPRIGTRGSPIKAVILTGAEIDQVTGLLSLREREPFAVCATGTTLAALADNSMFGALAPDVVKRQEVVPGAPVTLPGGLQAELFTGPCKAPLYPEGENPQTAIETGANVGVELSRPRTHQLHSGAAATPAVAERIARADVVSLTELFRDDEMIATGTGTKTGRRMGHMPIDGDDGSLAALTGVAARRIYAHQQYQSDSGRGSPNLHQ
jgi:pyrroloquinoline quinone biosynthesis protein B